MPGEAGNSAITSPQRLLAPARAFRGSSRSATRKKLTPQTAYPCRPARRNLRETPRLASAVPQRGSGTSAGYPLTGGVFSWGLTAMPSTDWPWFSREACALPACQRVRQVHRSSCSCRLGRSAFPPSPGENPYKGTIQEGGFLIGRGALRVGHVPPSWRGRNLGNVQARACTLPKLAIPGFAASANRISGRCGVSPQKGVRRKRRKPVEASGEGFPPLNTILTTVDWGGLLTGVGARMFTVTRMRLC